MNSRNFLKLFVPLVSAVLVASCSNDNQPLSVASSVESFKTAVTNDQMQIQDMGYIEGCLWAISMTKPTNPSKPNDYFLSKFNFSTSNWENSTNHWGVKCAVSLDGKCFHVNSSGEIWWVTTLNGTGTKINTPVIGGVSSTAIDIGVSGNNLWVVCQKSGIKYLYQGTYSGSGSSMTWSSTYALDSGYPARVSLGPVNAQVVVCSTTGHIYVGFDPEWYRVGNTTLFKDVANCDNAYVALSQSSYLYKLDPNSSELHFISTGIVAKSSVSMTQIQGINAALYIDAGNHLCVCAYSDL